MAKKNPKDNKKAKKEKAKKQPDQPAKDERARELSEEDLAKVAGGLVCRKAGGVQQEY